MSKIDLYKDENMFIQSSARDYTAEIIPFEPKKGVKQVWIKGEGIHFAPCGCKFDNFSDCFNHNDLECTEDTVVEEGLNNE